MVFSSVVKGIIITFDAKVLGLILFVPPSLLWFFLMILCWMRLAMPSYFPILRPSPKATLILRVELSMLLLLMSYYLWVISLLILSIKRCLV